MRLTRDRERAGWCVQFCTMVAGNSIAVGALQLRAQTDNTLTVCRRRGSLCGRWPVRHDSDPRSLCLHARENRLIEWQTVCCARHARRPSQQQLRRADADTA
jgi:hypothetical protein